MRNTLLFVSFLVICIFFGCKKTDKASLDLEMYPLVYDAHFPTPTILSDNKITKAKVALGRKLFYENKLSGDNSMNCAHCHQQQNGFSDSARYSSGIHGLKGTRQAMPIQNLVWNNNRFFWDGRAPLLRHQSIKPIEDPLEMAAVLSVVVAKLKKEESYQRMFMKAFGSEEVNFQRISFALEAFMFTLISDKSKYDQWKNGTETFSDSELRGKNLFFGEYNPFFPEISGADCAHCHSGSSFTNNEYMNNGLDATINFTDLGFYNVSNQVKDKATFRTPSLRNISLTAPYMHDGRFQTLEQVIDHYNDGIQNSSTLSSHLEQTLTQGLLLDSQDKLDLIAFLKTLSDPSFISNVNFAKPE